MKNQIWAALFAKVTMKWFKRREDSPPEYDHWPKRGQEELWMRGKVAYLRKHFPDRAHILFDISSGDYMPLTVHSSGNFGDDELDAYRRIKAENPDLVEQARQSDGHLYFRSRIFDPQDCPDTDMLP